MVAMPTLDLPLRTTKVFVEADAYQRLLEWAHDSGVYDRGTNQPREDGLADAIHTLVDHWEENDGD